MNEEDKTFTINLDEDYLTDTGSEYTFNMSDITFGTNTTDTITISSGDTLNTYITPDNIDLSNISTTINCPLDNSIDPDEVDRMCKEYPALEKVWRNFKSVYDMVKQDYKGKKDAGEIDDIIPF